MTRVLGDMVAAEGARAERIHVIPNGIEPAKFTEAPPVAGAKRALGLEGRVVLGFTGFMREWHALDQLVDVVAAPPERYLLLVGDGPARETVEARARELGVEGRVRITGIVARDDVAAHVAAFNVALQPDVVDYASPLKLFEYLALGRAAVAPDKPNKRKILTDGENALLFPSGDRAVMAAAIERLCADGALRERIGAAAYATSEAQQLTWGANAARFVRLARARVGG